MYRRLKRIRVVVSVAFLLLLTLSIVDAGIGATPFGQWLMHTQLVPAILAGSAVWIVVWALIVLSFGRVYCSSVCPLGTLQDAAGHLGRKLGKGEHKRYRYHAPQNVLRFPIPAIVAACLFVGFLAVVRLTDPYWLYARTCLAIARPSAIAFGGVAVAAVVIAICAVAFCRGRYVCNTICPIGGFLGLLGRSPVYRIDIDTDKCIHCGKCEDVCKAECIDLTHCVVDNSRCVVCFDCTAVCPNAAIVMRRGRYRLSTPLMQPTFSTNTTSPCNNTSTSCSTSSTTEWKKPTAPAPAPVRSSDTRCDSTSPKDSHC